MSIARVVEISATSDESFEDALQQGVARATKTLRNVRSAWIKEQEVTVDDGEIVRFKVNMLVTFVLDDADTDNGETGSTARKRTPKDIGTGPPAKGRRR
jgi:flavin-binding protein dodecin